MRRGRVLFARQRPPVVLAVVPLLIVHAPLERLLEGPLVLAGNVENRCRGRGRRRALGGERLHRLRARTTREHEEHTEG